MGKVAGTALLGPAEERKRLQVDGPDFRRWVGRMLDEIDLGGLGMDSELV